MEGAAVYMLAIVNIYDSLLFECDLTPEGSRSESLHLDQFILYAALDVLDEVVWKNPNLYLKQIDRFNDVQVSAYVTPGHIKFMLLHKTVNNKAMEEGIKEFFTEIHELYIKSIMNPFAEPNGLIKSTAFTERVKSIAHRILPGLELGK